MRVRTANVLANTFQNPKNILLHFHLFAETRRRPVFRCIKPLNADEGIITFQYFLHTEQELSALRKVTCIKCLLIYLEPIVLQNSPASAVLYWSSCLFIVCVFSSHYLPPLLCLCSFRLMASSRAL